MLLLINSVAVIFLALIILSRTYIERKAKEKSKIEAILEHDRMGLQYQWNNAVACLSKISEIGSKIESGKHPYRMDATSLRELVLEVSRDASDVLRHYPIEITVLHEFSEAVSLCAQECKDRRPIIIPTWDGESISYMVVHSIYARVGKKYCEEYPDVSCNPQKESYEVGISAKTVQAKRVPKSSY
jgi:hypothetical protein